MSLEEGRMASQPADAPSPHRACGVPAAPGDRPAVGRQSRPRDVLLRGGRRAGGAERASRDGPVAVSRARSLRATGRAAAMPTSTGCAVAPSYVSTERPDELKTPTPATTTTTLAAGPPPCRVYRRRWLILAIFIAYSMSNAVQWVQFSIISNVVVGYYGVDSFLVDLTSMIYMITYIPLVFPASWMLDKVGLRTTAIIGIAGTAAGSWVKVGAVSPDRFYVAFVGQTIVAVSQTCIISLPSRLAAVWFGPDQVSTACSLGVFGNQLGVALGFLLPPYIVRNTGDPDLVGSSLAIMFYSMAAFTTLLLVVIVLFFQAAPPLPPSPAQAIQKESKTNDFFGSIKRLLLNRGYVLLLLSYGINIGVFYAISTLLNTLVLTHYKNAEEDAGRIGLTLTVAGMAGSAICGFVLDKTRRFKETTLVVYACSLVGMVIFTFTIDCGIIEIVYLTAFVLGFFMTGYLPVGFELAAELTYPEPEGTSAGILNAVVQVFGIVLTMAYGHLLKVINDIWANSILFSVLAVGLLLTFLIKSDLRRQAATSHAAAVHVAQVVAAA
ncbi:heme transporter FLVCR2-like isoform X2 [Bacillus rossius redtenbacheri]|uniref:heme transporter FLVCR2-like isoform X2 n=1 Tax=Bacillus rossius redtenbacheri TaxID=93214 RepID=UPI002FDD6173